MNIKNKIYVLGDSFSANGSSPITNPSNKYIFWVDIFKKYFEDSCETLVYAEGSRDTQTILDTWIKILPKIQKNDFLIIGFPYFSRYRFPRSEKSYKVENELTIRHIGQVGEYDVSNNELEFFDKTYNRDYLLEKLSYNEIINSSKASSLNNKEIIESLLKLTKCKSLLFSWTRFKDGYKPDTLKDKGDLEKEIGYWGTQHEVHKRTNGKYGILNDLHWDETMHRKFAEYAIKLFKQ